MRGVCYDALIVSIARKPATPLLGQPKLAAMSLNFRSPQEAADHAKTRTTAGLIGTALGGYAGGHLGRRFGGTKGMLAGAAVGGLLGNATGRVGTDVAHDVPQRTMGIVHGTTHYLDQMGGSGIRVASAQPSATDFAEFAQREGEGDSEAPGRGLEEELEEKLRPPQFGPATSLEGGEATNHNVSMALSGSGAV